MKKTAAQKASLKKYNHSTKGKLAYARYNNSVLGKENDARRNTKAILTGTGAQAKRAMCTRNKIELATAYSPSDDKRIRLSVPVKSVIILSDLQIPFEDPGAVEQALQVMDTVRPDLVILNGDIVDCYQLSSFDKNPKHRSTITAEGHKRTRTLLANIAHVPQKIWLGGNHEHRFNRLIWQEYERNGKLSAIAVELLAALGGDADSLANDPNGWFAKLYDAPKYGVQYYPYGHRLYLAEDNLVVTHGKYVSRHSGQSAKRTLEWLGRSCVVGHTHRMGNHLVTQDGITYGAWENGCLCQLEPEYDDSPNWQSGFSLVKVNGPEFHVIQVPIIRRAGKPVAVYHQEELAV